MAEVTELVTKFSFAGSISPLLNYNTTLGKSIIGLAAVGAALAASTIAFQKWAGSTLKALDPLIQLSRNTNTAIDSIQELGFAASVSGSSMSAVESTIDSLSQKIGDAAQKGSEDFSRLGISVRDSNGHVKGAVRIIEEVRAAFARMRLSRAEQASFASSLGIDPSLIQLLNKTGSEMSALRAKAQSLGIVTKEQADSAADYNDAITVMDFALGALGKQIAIAVAPQMQELSEGFVDLLQSNKEWIKEGISKTITIITELAKSFIRILPVLGIIAAAFTALSIVTAGFGVVLGVVLSPVVLTTAAIVALWLVIDDLIVGASGGKSVIHDFFKEFLGVDLADLQQSITDIFMSIDRLLNGDFAGAWENFKSAAVLAFKFVRDLFTGLFEGLAPDWVVNLFGDAAALSAAIKGVGTVAASKFGITPSLVTAGAGQSSQASSQTVNQTIDINILSNDPQAAGQSVNDALQKQLSNAKAQIGAESNSVRGGR